MTYHRIFLADSRDMPELPDESVHLVVTSPPYWCLKDYSHPGQIGYLQTYEEYLESLRAVLAEIDVDLVIVGARRTPPSSCGDTEVVRAASVVDFLILYTLMEVAVRALRWMVVWLFF